MGVDFDECRVCRQTYADCGDVRITRCSECKEKICSNCLDKHIDIGKIKYFVDSEPGIQNEDEDLLEEFCPLCNPKKEGEKAEPVIDIGTRTKEDIEKALKDSEDYYKKTFPMKPTTPIISISDVAEGIKALAVANEICTLKWVLGKGKLNCYGDKDKTKGMENGN